jgi:hypothetical protein
VPASNPLIAGVPMWVPNQAPASTAPYDPAGGGAVNPYAGNDSATNAAGTAEPVATHVALVVAFALLGVYVLRVTGFKFVVAGSVG